MTMKLYLSPTNYTPDNGIGQVIEAQRRYLPEHGFEFVSDPAEADIRAGHIWATAADNDVQHVHGLHWNGDEAGYEDWHGLVNHRILETARRAWAITVPSEWVAMPFKRDMRLSPQVIGHGISLSDWTPLPVSDRKEYLLWNKNRADIVSSPQAAVGLARRGIPVISTFGEPEFMQVTGPVPHGQMKSYLQYAGVYLSTAKETFGIGILEALAVGVPVLGYAHGGILDLVQHKSNGYLVEPGDVNGLETGYRWLLENREEMQSAILASVRNRDWKDIIGRYAQLYREVYKEKQRQRKVSVVITNYNYADYVGQAIKSALAQTMPVEVIVVDDSSGPESHAVLEGYRTTGGSEVNVIYNAANLGVSESRNRGVGAAGGRYVVCLDADDYLEPAYIETLFKAMEADRALGIAYTGLKLHFENGESSVGGWPPEFDFEKMAKPGVPPPNCIPCAAMFRRDMWERAGGYRQEYAPGEDTEFWLRGLSVGFNAKRVTDQPLFNYRMHGGSASRTKQYIDITGDKPWTKDANLMPMAAPTKKPNLVRSYSEPLVSVIIPVGPGHAKHLNKALDSLVAQTFKQWEVIVIDDTYATGVRDAFDLKRYPFVRMFQTLGRGAGSARNDGIREAKAPLLFFLDADDYLAEATALEKMVKGYVAAGGGKYVFSDWYTAVPGKALEHQNCQEYDQEATRGKSRHAISVLVETEKVKKVGGFDESLPTLEDWDFFISLAARGFCGVRVPEPLLVYRTETGARRQVASTPGSTVFQQIVDKWEDVKFMACCGGNSQLVNQATQVMSYPKSSEAAPDGTVRMHFIGVHTGTATYFGYQFGQDGINDYGFVRVDDVNKLLQTGFFEMA
jgi:glycosyltransferase involved in cell wall biosynthesis